LDEGGSLIHLRRRFYKYASPTGFAAFASFARQKIQTPIAPIVHPKIILARRSSPRANRKLARSAPVPGRSNVANQAVIETSKAHRRPSLAAAGDGHTPPLIL
jgi:hypothetical protein